MAEPARKIHTLDDLLHTPEGVKAELVDGVLHTEPRPAAVHAVSSTGLGMILGGPFQFGVGGPGGWIILQEQTVNFRGKYLVPDLSGWRVERLPEIPDEPVIEVIPDWVCEILSPSSASRDKVEKFNYYLENRVPWYWIVDPANRFIDVFRLEGERYVIEPPQLDGDKIRARPFDAIEIDLGMLWSRLRKK
ncbi:MAG: hypothetical protein GMKNLPBB_02024 [Myxococcota bacterium]|nr:hypothetical protein [Myxococcota bacterium]